MAIQTIYQLFIFCYPNPTPILSSQPFFKSRVVKHHQNPLYRCYQDQILSWCFHDRDFEDNFIFETKIKPLPEIGKDIRDRNLTKFIWELLHAYEFMQYQKSSNPKKYKLLAIAKIFKESNYISSSNYEIIRCKFERRCLKDFIVDFIIDCHRNGDNTCENLKRRWEKHISCDFCQTWTFIIDRFIENRRSTDPIISTLYQICKPYIRKIHDNNPFDELSEKIFKGLSKLEKYIFFSKSLSSVHFDAFQYKAYELHKEMESKVSQNSVFFHEKKIIGAKDQIDSILMLLREAVEDSRGRIFFETYMLDVIGSYSNGLALDYESSIDICIQFDDGLKKLRALQILGILSDSITKRVYSSKSKQLKQIKQRIEYTFQIEPGIVSYLKIKYKNINYSFIKDTNYYATSFHIYVNETNSIYSSQILGLYTVSPYIKTLAILTKLWFKRKVNSSSIDKNINGYVVVIMIIFYLIKTEQVGPIIQNLNEFALQSPLRREENFLNLYDNFKGWLQFQLENRNTQPFYQINLMNPEKRQMYTPCRLRIRLTGDFYQVVAQTLQNLNSYQNIEELFKYPKI